MATQTLAAEASNSNPSVILNMHARYQETWKEYDRLDSAKTALSDHSLEEKSLGFRYGDAMRASSAESDALQLAILYQVPATWQEALVLQYHIHTAADPHSTMTEGEKKAVEVALDTIFDFMCDEVDHDENDCRIFHRAECLVSERRRLRTGRIQNAT